MIFKTSIDKQSVYLIITKKKNKINFEHGNHPYIHFLQQKYQTIFFIYQLWNRVLISWNLSELNLLNATRNASCLFILPLP